MAEDVSSSFAVENDSGSELSSLIDDSTEISEYDSVSNSSLSPRAEVALYLFEPERSLIEPGESSVDREVEPDLDGSERLGNSDWCTCGNCQPMDTTRESLCCKEMEKMVALLNGDSPPSCISQHPDFSSVCLCRAVLTVDLHSYRYHYGTTDVPSDENRRFRYLAYRQLTWWGWNHLGRHRRVVLPSCAVVAIRNKFPSEEYTGHQDPPPTP